MAFPGMSLKRASVVAEAPASIERNAAARAVDEAAIVKVPAVPASIADRVFVSADSTRSFAYFAVTLRLMADDQATALSRHHRTKRGDIGELAVGTGALTPEGVAHISAAQGVEISVDARHAGLPQFLTWIEDVRGLGIIPKVRRVSAQDLVAVRESRRVEPSKEQSDLKTLTKARDLISDAALVKSSDIHIRINEKFTEVLVRVKGDLQVAEKYSMDQEEGDALVRSMYTGLATSKEGTYNPREFQDAQIRGDVIPGSGLSSVRIIRGPKYPEEAGCSYVVARLQYETATGKQADPSKAGNLQLRKPKAPIGDIELIGFTPLQQELCDRLIRLPAGIVLATGPTGSGKTTTLYNLMKRQAQLFVHKAQFTIENPPEYPQDWAVQLASDGDDFQARLRDGLRSDPDIIMLGEIRAAAEAVAAVQAAMTGHFVWSTLHVNDPFSAFRRLENLDRALLDPQKIADADLISGLLAQRIIPILCGECKQPLAEKPEALTSYLGSIVGTWGNGERLYVRGDVPDCGCCFGTGIIRTQAVAEVVVTDEEFMDDVLAQGINAARKRYRTRKDADKSMLGNAMDLVLAGMVDPNDAHASVRLRQKREGA
ncbi:ATPase, T2SS/T4P/T4SS family [Burkholderia sp. Ac-20365]|uniref:GspE/PulE family protein n=1 Tax=Burkholderia sp. Ac-20365 TaxID=2703897 RepID=UPI00197C6BE3|nr:ATPase, T2SS/T4P/T4SS family [Burkholderia sp. Ac-20365]MBN3761069.1 Flp pilus assembly complex ATPase component [Burkholderia sp. Ac-20365]